MYYARMADVGYEAGRNEYLLNDATFYGVGLKIYEGEGRRLELHSLLVKDVSGNIYVTSLVAESKGKRLDYFAAIGWSHTDDKAVDQLGNGLLSSWWDAPEDRDGYSLYLGAQYKLPAINGLIGLEANYGSQYWLSFDQEDENSKLATRGKALEIYAIYAPPVVDLYATVIDKQQTRLGYCHLWYDFTGSGFYLGEPMDIDELAASPLSVSFYEPRTTAYKVYLNYEFFF